MPRRAACQPLDAASLFVGAASNFLPYPLILSRTGLWSVEPTIQPPTHLAKGRSQDQGGSGGSDGRGDLGGHCSGCPGFLRALRVRLVSSTVMTNAVGLSWRYRWWLKQACSSRCTSARKGSTSHEVLSPPWGGLGKYETKAIPQYAPVLSTKNAISRPSFRARSGGCPPSPRSSPPSS
jgi:hypothetical protein